MLVNVQTGSCTSATCACDSASCRRCWPVATRSCPAHSRPSASRYCPSAMRAHRARSTNTLYLSTIYCNHRKFARYSTLYTVCRNLIDGGVADSGYIIVADRRGDKWTSVRSLLTYLTVSHAPMSMCTRTGALPVNDTRSVRRQTGRRVPACDRIDKHE